MLVGKCNASVLLVLSVGLETLLENLRNLSNCVRTSSVAMGRKDVS